MITSLLQCLHNPNNLSALRSFKKLYFSIKWTSSKLYFRQQQTIYGRIIVRPVDLYCQFDFLHITHIIWTLYYNWIHEKQCCGNIARKSKKETMLTKVSYLTDTAQLFLKEELWHQNLTVKCLLQRPFSLLIQ